MIEYFPPIFAFRALFMQISNCPVQNFVFKLKKSFRPNMKYSVLLFKVFFLFCFFFVSENVGSRKLKKKKLNCKNR